MKKILVISRCLKIDRKYYHFHFKGYYRGEKIRKLCFDSSLTTLEVENGRNYIIEVIVEDEVIGEVLFGEIIKIKEMIN